MNSIDKHNSINEEFWENAYKTKNIGWDLGGPTPIFNNWIKSIHGCYKICVLGAGNGWDAINFAKYGHTVTAVDFSKSAVRNMKDLSKINNVDLDIIKSNIFELDKKFTNYFDFIIEYTCYCAILPKQRYDYIELSNSLLKSNGKIIAILFPLDKSKDESGPPYGVDLKKTIKMFSKYFKVELNKFSALSIKPRINREKFIILKRNENNI